MSISLVLGGARSGKSSFAEGLCHGERHYIATAQAFDAEMRQRIAQHQIDRGAGWTTHEVPMALAAQLPAIAIVGRTVLVDCLTLWLSNVMLAGLPWRGAIDELLDALPRCAAEVVFVSNEVGLGIVPDNALAREFRDAQG